jgi:hypothetical protein
MTIAELVIQINYLERQMSLYEEKYGVLSEDFYAALMAGKLARYDEFDETRADFCRWNSLYRSWLWCKDEYSRQIGSVELDKALSFQPAY